MTYLRNTWYAAAWSQEVQDRPLARMLLGEPVVFYRDGDGKPVALADRCPHRFAPLSKGQVVGNALQCPYHGLRYDGSGACVQNPHGRITENNRVATYALLERWGVIWIWMGAPAASDPALLPDFSVIADTENHAVVSGYLKVGAHYQMVADNLLDLSHAEYLHPMLGNPDAASRVKFSLKVVGTTVWSINDWPDEPITPMWKLMFESPTGRGDRRAHMRWDPPSNLLNDIGFTHCGRPASEGSSMPNAHLLTPETERTTHYFWAAARTHKRDDPTIGEKIRQGIDQAFRNEDEPMVQACQERMSSTDVLSLHPVLLPTDVAAVRARRMLAQLIKAEEGAAS